MVQLIYYVYYCILIVKEEEKNMSLYNPKITETNPEDKVTSPESLVFSGGGIKGLTYEYCFRMENHHRTVFIVPAGIGTLDFKLTEDQKKALKDNGYKATIDYLENLN